MCSILVLSEKYWPYGGAELATHLILRLLTDDEFGITVLTGMRDIEYIKDVKYLYHPLLDVGTKIQLWKNLFKLMSDKWFVDLMKKNDVIYIPRISYPVIPFAKRYGKKVIVHMHNYQPLTYSSIVFYSKDEKKIDLLSELSRTIHYELLENNSIFKALTSSFLTPINKLCQSWISGADAVICVSNRQAKIISDIIPNLNAQIKVIYNPLPCTSYSEEKFKEPTFLYLGGSSYCKGIHVFLNACLKLLNQTKCRFVATKINKKWSKIFTNYNSANYNSFSICGRIPYEELNYIRSRSTALLFPSIWEEPLPYAVLEAMLAGTIPIASMVGGVTEIVKGTRAEDFLIEPGDPKSFSEAMEIILTYSKEQIKDIGVSLRHAVQQKFNNNLIKKELSKIFDT